MILLHKIKASMRYCCAAKAALQRRRVEVLALPCMHSNYLLLDFLLFFLGAFPKRSKGPHTREEGVAGVVLVKPSCGKKPEKGATAATGKAFKGHAVLSPEEGVTWFLIFFAGA